VTKDSHVAFLDLSIGDWVTVFGQHAAKVKIAAGRAKMYEHPKAGRPADEVLLDQLRAYRKRLPSSLKGTKATGLPRLRGITRASRYQQLGIAIARRLGRIGKGKAHAAIAGTPRGKNR
jgi:hypothetical protein